MSAVQVCPAGGATTDRQKGWWADGQAAHHTLHILSSAQQASSEPSPAPTPRPPSPAQDVGHTLCRPEDALLLWREVRRGDAAGDLLREQRRL